MLLMGATGGELDTILDLFYNLAHLDIARIAHTKEPT